MKFQSNDSSEAVPQLEVNETDESQAPVTRTLNRERRRLGWQVDYVIESNVAYCLFTEEREPSTLQEALNNSDASSLDYNRLHADPCAYFKRFGNNNFIILLLYVNDMLVAGPNKDRINKLKAQLAREFEMKDLGPENKILGMKIHRDRVSRKIWFSQKSYVKKILQRFNMQDCKPISTLFPTNVKLSFKMSPSSEKERMEMSRVPYASAVGSLIFVMICTRLDIAHAVGVVSRYMAEPGRGALGSCDLDGSKSTTGYVFTLSGGTSGVTFLNTAFREQHKLAPMEEDRKRRWRREVGWILSMTGYIVEFVPSQQTSK
nr:Gag-Pol polyprotein [Tanacetum cinerariifolium]